MSIELRVATGARAGARQSFDKSIVAVGRHPMCDLRFDPEADRDVSARHAEIRAEGEAWVLRDLGSTNGTFANGVRLAGDHVLREGDVLAFGDAGPRVEVLALAPHPVASAPRASGAAGAGAARPVAVMSPVPMALDTPPTSRPSRDAAPPAGPRSSPVPLQPRPTTGERIAQAVRESTRGLRRMVAAALALLVVGAGVAVWLVQRDAGERRAQVEALIRRNDSLAAAFEREMRESAGRVTGLDSALAAARAEGSALRAQIATASSDAEVRAATERLARVQTQRSALATANTAIASENAPAVAILAVQLSDGRAWTGTAFGVSPRGLLVTNRHLVRDEAGGEARAILVKFSGTRDWIPTRVERVVDDADLALLQVEGRGPYPAVRGIARTPVPVGAPVAILGYPLGLETAMEGRGGDDFLAAATFGVGTTSKVLRDVLQIDAFAGQGSSGSPVFDRDGRVAGVVYGGARESAGRIVYAVPAARLLAALPDDARP